MTINNRRKLEKLIDLFQPRIRDAFLAAVRDVVDNVILVDVIRAIENGDPIRAFELLGFNQSAMRPITRMIEDAFETGGMLTGEGFPKYLNTPSGRAVFRFDVRNSRAEAWLRDHSSSLVTNITNDVREIVRVTMERGMLAGENPRRTALELVGRIDPTTKVRTGGTIGLTPGQEKWVANTRRDLNDMRDIAARVRSGEYSTAQAREELSKNNYFSRALRRKGSDNQIVKSIVSGKDLDVNTVDRLVMTYRNNALRYRGEVIGRTEALQALNRSEYEAHMQAVDTGALRRQDVKRIWDSAGDGRVRDTHRVMDGQAVSMDEPFISPSGSRMMYPGDTSLGADAAETIQCRCRVRIEADFLAQWND
jgi:hypothetical protein